MSQLTLPIPIPYGNIAYAGFWRRAGAGLLDYILLGIAINVASGVMMALTGLLIGFSLPIVMMHGQPETLHSTFNSLIRAYSNIAGFSIPWLYFTLMESSSKQATLGKMAFNLKVTDESLQRISFAQANIRYFSKILSFMLLLVGYLMIGLTQRKQGLHDMIARCLVIRSSRPYPKPN